MLALVSLLDDSIDERAVGQVLADAVQEAGLRVAVALLPNEPAATSRSDQVAAAGGLELLRTRIYVAVVPQDAVVSEDEVLARVDVAWRDALTAHYGGSVMFSGAEPAPGELRWQAENEAVAVFTPARA